MTVGMATETVRAMQAAETRSATAEQALHAAESRAAMAEQALPEALGQEASPMGAPRSGDLKSLLLFREEGMRKDFLSYAEMYTRRESWYNGMSPRDGLLKFLGQLNPRVLTVLL